LANNAYCPARRLAVLLINDSRGAEIAEAAAVLPLMFMVLLGIFWFGQAFSIYGAITRAAEVGARAGAAPYCSSCNSDTNTLAQFSTNAVNAVQASLQASNLNPAAIPNSSPANVPVFNSCISSVQGNPGCSTASGSICVQVPVQLTSTGTNGPIAGAAGVCGISVTFQYPYQFWLPFTSLNKQQIFLPASARVRMETH
jgi:Flp pilus assembly protein TadG